MLFDSFTVQAISKEELKPPLKPVIRIATDADRKQLQENKEKEKKAFGIAEEKIKKEELKRFLEEVGAIHHSHNNYVIYR